MSNSPPMPGKRFVPLFGAIVGGTFAVMAVLILYVQSQPPEVVVEGRPAIRCDALALGPQERRQEALGQLIDGFEVRAVGADQARVGVLPLMVGSAGPLPGHEQGDATFLELLWPLPESAPPMASGVRLLCLQGMVSSSVSIQVPMEGEAPAKVGVIPLEQRGRATMKDAQAMWRQRCSDAEKDGQRFRFCQLEAHAPGAAALFLPALHYVSRQEGEGGRGLTFSSELKRAYLEEGKVTAELDTALSWHALSAECMAAGRYSVEGGAFVPGEGCELSPRSVQARCLCGPFPVTLPPRGLREPTACVPQGEGEALVCRALSGGEPLTEESVQRALGG